MKVLIDIHDDDYNRIMQYGLILEADRSIIADAIKNGTPLPKGATNGEALCMLFPNIHYTLSDKSPRVVTTIGVASSFDIDWWNAPYKAESEDKE